MKVFISWSGVPSQRVALALRDWLPDLFNGIEIFVSSEDIRKGKRWLVEVSKELETSNFGVVCLTHDNLEAPWILFEAGALSKFIKESSLFTLLTSGLKPSDVDGPLSHFQHTLFERDDFYKLCKSIDEANGTLKREEPRLRKLFDMLWNDLQQKVNNSLKADSKPEKKRSSDDMLREILDVVTSLAKNSPQRSPEATVQNVPHIALWKGQGQPLLIEDELLLQELNKLDKHLYTFVSRFVSRLRFQKNIKQLTLAISADEDAAAIAIGQGIPIIKQALTKFGYNDWNVVIEPT